MQLSKPFNTIYIAKPDYLNELCEELGDVAEIIGDMVFSPVRKPDVCFALDVWIEPTLVEFSSISEAVKLLRQVGKFWYLLPTATIRRSRLIEEQLRKLPELKRTFPVTDPIPEIGCYTLLDKNTLLYCKRRWKKWPLGHCHFIEDKHNPPNRAYLKLWEALTLLDTYPHANEHAVDLGASPGGWTYVLQTLGADVLAIDKAPLEPRITKLPRVTYMQQSAFALKPSDWSRNIDWLLSDIACYPDRLYDYVLKWIDANKAKQLIFTIKLQGKTDLAMLKKFQSIPNSRTLHLYHNKHEATFFYPTATSLAPVF